MSKILIVNANSSSSQSNDTENIISLSPNISERTFESQTKKNQPLNETPLSTKGNVKSYCRLRPNNTLFSSLGKFEIQNNNKTLIVDFTPEQDKNNPSKQLKFKYNFTEIFGTGTENEIIFGKVCRQSIEELFTKNKNALIFVFGITNSGKTYTVKGNSQDFGILQLSLKALLNEYQKFEKTKDLCQITCTYIEIYNEEIFDLLSEDRKKIKIREMGNRFYPQGCIVKNIRNEDDFRDALTIGEINITKAETNANPYSSRSHSIFRVELSYKDGSTNGRPVSLCIVDLAGAERVSRSGMLGNGVKEAGNINSSLLVLKKCFDAMEANSHPNNADKKMIVPIRESKLTMLFKEYFSDHQNISVICTINPDKNEMLDIRSVLSFGAKALRVKPIKSWVPVYTSSSKEISPNRNENRENNFLQKDKKRYRLLTDKKYIINPYHKNNNSQKSISKEKNRKCSEDYYSYNLSYNKKKNINQNSTGKIQNIKLNKNKKIERYNINSLSKQIKNMNDENSINNSPNIHNYTQSNISNDEYLNNNENHKNYEQRIKCTTNPFEIRTTNNLFLKNNPSKEEQQLERQKKEEKQKEIQEKLSKKGEQTKHIIIDLLIKQYYNNKEINIQAYENQCNNIDIKEAEILLSKNNNIFSIKNPFIKYYEEDKKILSKNHQINFYYIPEKNNDLDVIRTNYNLIEELQLNINNSNEHDQTKVQEYLDKSLEVYQTSKFKPYFGIGESLIKKTSDNQNVKNNELDNKNIVGKFNLLNNDIEMADNIINNENNIFNDSFTHDFNFKRKGKNNKIIYENNDNNNKNINNNKEDINKNVEEKNKDNELEDIDYNSNFTDTEEDVRLEKKTKNNIKKKKKEKKQKKEKSKKKQKEKKIEENEEEENKDKEYKENNESKNEDENENEKKEETEDNEEKYQKKYPKNKNSKSKRSKRNIKTDDSSDDDTSNDENNLLVSKRNKEKKKKNKKRKIESDNDTSDDNTLSDDCVNFKSKKSKKYKSKKRKKNNS